ncbi:MAG: hypothetical protein R3C68_12950 [Myxococcota bacterium]
MMALSAGVGEWIHPLNTFEPISICIKKQKIEAAGGKATQVELAPKS